MKKPHFLTSLLVCSLLYGQEEQNEFTPYFSYTAEAWNIEDGGFETGGRAIGQIVGGFDWSPALLGGGTLHAEVQNIHGNDPSGFAGDANALSNIAFDEGTRLFQAWYGRETNWGSLKTGWLPWMTTLWDRTMPDCSSIRPSADANQSFNTSAPILPIGGLCIWGNFDLSEESALQIGIYDGNAGDFATNEDGLDNGLSDQDGAMVMAEYSRTTETFGGSTTWKLGGYHHTGKEFENFTTSVMEEGLGAAYIVVTHAASENLGLWIRLGKTFEDETSTVTGYYEGGVVLSSPIANRPDDLLGIGYFHTEFGDAYLGANPGATSSEAAIEVTYQAPISENFYIQPDLQWIFDAHDSKTNVFVAGIRAVLEF